MSRSSKRKPKKRTFFDERDSENDENSNNIDELGFNKGKEGNNDKEEPEANVKVFVAETIQKA